MAETEAVDADEDGVLALEDCDDTNPRLGAVAADQDCDGVLTADDCDDFQAAVGRSDGDRDCDGIPTAEDCDDTNSSLGSNVGDRDCDGLSTEQDCDDGDATWGARSSDRDCDRVETSVDCNDDNASIGSRAQDADCDGTPNASDECPNDPTLQVSPPPEIRLDFPPARASTNASALTLRGRLITFCENEVASLQVERRGDTSSVSFAVDPQGGLVWSFEAELDVDQDNTFTLDVADQRARIGEATVTVSQYTAAGLAPTFSFAKGIALDDQRRTAYVVDESLRGVYAVDLESGASRVLSAAGVGSGASFSSDLEGGVALDAPNQRLLVTDDGANAIVAVNLANGNRSVVSGTTMPGPNIRNPHGIALDPTSNRAFYVDIGIDAVVEVDLTTGNRTLISGSGRGSGINLPSPRDLLPDLSEGRLLVAEASRSAVVAVDLATGDRMVLSGSGVGSGPTLDGLVGVGRDPVGGRIFAIIRTQNSEAVVAVDGQTGDRALVSGRGRGASLVSGASFADPRDAIYDRALDRFLVVDAQLPFLIALEAESGNRVLLTPTPPTTPAVGDGPSLVSPAGIARSVEPPALYVTDDGLDAIVAVDLNSGQRTLVANATTAGAALERPLGLGLDLERGRLLVPTDLAAAEGVFAVGLQTGTSQPVSDASSADDRGLPMDTPRGRVALEPGGGTALVGDAGRDSVLRVDLVTGQRTTLSGPDQAQLRGVQSIALDPLNGRALLTTGSRNNDAIFDGLVGVDLVSGARTVLATLSTSSAPVGTGIDMTNPRAVGLDRGRALIFDADLDVLVAVDLNTLDRSLVSSGHVGRGDLLRVPDNFRNALDIDSQRRLVYVVSQGSSRINLVDLETGDQVTISQ